MRPRRDQLGERLKTAGRPLVVFLSLILIASLLLSSLDRRQPNAVALAQSIVGVAGPVDIDLSSPTFAPGNRMIQQELSRVTFDCNKDLADLIRVANGQDIPDGTIDTRILVALRKLSQEKEHLRVNIRCGYIETPEAIYSRENDPGSVRNYSPHRFGTAIDIYESGVIQENLWKKTLTVPLSWQLIGLSDIFANSLSSLNNLSGQFGNFDLLKVGFDELGQALNQIQSVSNNLASVEGELNQLFSVNRELESLLKRADIASSNNIFDLEREINRFDQLVFKINDRLFGQSNINDLIANPTGDTAFQKFMEQFPIILASGSAVAEKARSSLGNPTEREFYRAELTRFGEVLRLLSLAAKTDLLKDELPKNLLGQINDFCQRVFTIPISEGRPVIGIPGQNPIEVPGQSVKAAKECDEKSSRSKTATHVVFPPSDATLDRVKRRSLILEAFRLWQEGSERLDKAEQERWTDNQSDVKIALFELKALEGLKGLSDDSIVVREPSSGSPSNPVNRIKGENERVVIKREGLKSLTALASLESLSILDGLNDQDILDESDFKDLRFLEFVGKASHLAALDQVTEFRKGDQEIVAATLRGLGHLANLKFLANLDSGLNLPGLFSGLKDLGELSNLSSLGDLAENNPKEFLKTDLSPLRYLSRLSDNPDPTYFDPTDPNPEGTLGNLARPILTFSKLDFSGPSFPSGFNRENPLSSLSQLEDFGRSKTAPGLFDSPFIGNKKEEQKKLLDLLGAADSEGHPTRGQIKALKRVTAGAEIYGALIGSAGIFDPQAKLDPAIVDRATKNLNRAIIRSTDQFEALEPLAGNLDFLFDPRHLGQDGYTPEFGFLDLDDEDEKGRDLESPIKIKRRDLLSGRLKRLGFEPKDVESVFNLIRFSKITSEAEFLTSGGGKLLELAGFKSDEINGPKLKLFLKLTSQPKLLFDESGNELNVLKRIGFSDDGINKIKAIRGLEGLVGSFDPSEGSRANNLKIFGINPDPTANRRFDLARLSKNPDQILKDKRLLAELGLSPEIVSAISNFDNLVSIFRGKINPETLVAEALRLARQQFAQFMLNHPDQRIRHWYRTWDSYLTRIAPQSFYRPRARAEARSLVSQMLALKDQDQPLQIQSLYDLDGQPLKYLGRPNLGSFRLKERQNAIWFVHIGY